MAAAQDAIERSNFYIQAFGELKEMPPTASDNQGFPRNFTMDITGQGAQQIPTRSSRIPRDAVPNLHANEGSDDSAYTSVGEISSDSICSSDQDVEEILHRTYGPPPDSEMPSSDDNTDGNSEYPWSDSEHM